ncbi:ThiF family adenylyltransferase, partial [Pantoea sp. SIMBA_079]
CHVAVIGMGGVGSWVVEALVRTGVGRLTLIDADDLCVSNTNRQLPALAGQYGRNKAEAMAERCLAINPEVAVEAVPAFVTPA